MKSEFSTQPFIRPLSRKDRKRPYRIIEDFFDHYHLQDGREMLWNWTIELLGSEGSIASDARERSNVLFFYEKLQALLEAAYLIRLKKQQQMNKKDVDKHR